MQKRLLTLFILAALLGVAFTPASQAEVQSLPPPARIAEAREVVSFADPAARIRLPKQAKYLGGERFALYGVADCELHVYVEASKDKTVKRIYWIQFEQYLQSEPGAAYDYSGPNYKPMTLWGRHWRVRPRFGQSSEKPSEGSDWAHARAIIEAAGYTLPPDMMNVAFFHMLDDPEGSGTGRKEVAIFYSEDMALTGHAFADFVQNNALNQEAWQPVSEKLVRRAAKRVTYRD